MSQLTALTTISRTEKDLSSVTPQLAELFSRLLVDKPTSNYLSVTLVGLANFGTVSAEARRECLGQIFTRVGTTGIIRVINQLMTSPMPYVRYAWFFCLLNLFGPGHSTLVRLVTSGDYGVVLRRALKDYLSEHATASAYAFPALVCNAMYTLASMGGDSITRELQKRDVASLLSQALAACAARRPPPAALLRRHGDGAGGLSLPEALFRLLCLSAGSPAAREELFAARVERLSLRAAAAHDPRVQLAALRLLIVLCSHDSASALWRLGAAEAALRAMTAPAEALRHAGADLLSALCEDIDMRTMRLYPPTRSLWFECALRSVKLEEGRLGFEKGAQVMKNCAEKWEWSRQGETPGERELRECANCGRTRRELFGATAKLRTCGRCKLVFYCSKPCSINHWHEHRKDCLSNKKNES